ncbi:hypothetical protein M3Y96_01203700 [Aphelenchoides besseyi]|nr:hypothetical protein M3Y96_01203700 [Aphelenchoides besseyi]
MDFSPPAPQLQDVAFDRSQCPKAKTRPIQQPPECIVNQPTELNGDRKQKKVSTVRYLLFILLLFFLFVLTFIGSCIATNNLIEIQDQKQFFDIAIILCFGMAGLCLLLAILLYVKIRTDCRRPQEQNVVYTSHTLNL